MPTRNLVSRCIMKLLNGIIYDTSTYISRIRGWPFIGHRSIRTCAIDTTSSFIRIVQACFCKRFIEMIDPLLLGQFDLLLLLFPIYCPIPILIAGVLILVFRIKPFRIVRELNKGVSGDSMVLCGCKGSPSLSRTFRHFCQRHVWHP